MLNTQVVCLVAYSHWLSSWFCDDTTAVLGQQGHLPYLILAIRKVVCKSRRSGFWLVKWGMLA